MFDRIKNWLQRSPHVHIRQNVVGSLRDLVNLIDRFIDGKLSYELEWDDFVSWEHDQPSIESVRSRIADLEPLFFAKNRDDRRQALSRLIAERDRVATMCGMAPRGTSQDSIQAQR